MLTMTCVAQQQFRLILRPEQSACEGIFEQTEDLIFKDDDYIEAIEFVARSKKMERYQDLIDFLFCEIFTEWRLSCFNYYKGKGQLLKDHPKMTQEMINSYDLFMVHVALPTMLASYRERLNCHWKGFRVVLKVAERLVYNNMD